MRRCFILLMIIAAMMVATALGYGKAAADKKGFLMAQLDTEEDDVGSEPPQGECTTYGGVCLAATHKCTADFLATPHLCFNDTSEGGAKCCMFPLFCIDGTCQEDNAGTSCGKDSDCRVNYFGSGLSACVRGKCQMVGNVGDACSNYTDCAEGSPCVSGVCAGWEAGHDCQAPRVSESRSKASAGGLAGPDHRLGLTGYSCKTGHTCSQGKCVAQAVKEAAACDPSVGCVAGLVCNEKVCVPQGSVADGAHCTVSDACTANSYCNTTSKLCQTGFVYGLVECTENVQCGVGTSGKCDACNHHKGKLYCGQAPQNMRKDCKAEWFAALSCWASNGCSPVPSSSTAVCTQQKCPSETNAILACLVNCQSFRDLDPGCVADNIIRNCPLVPTWARVLIAFGLLFAIVAVVFVSYAVARKLKAPKNEYAPVGGH